MEQAAEALEDGRDPLERSFLVEHHVTADECFALAEGMATGIRLALLMVVPLAHATRVGEASMVGEL
jgi:regulator of RNase E activity RraB